MKIFTFTFVLFMMLFATAPEHTWTGMLLECANHSLKKPREHNITKEELESITEFSCNYSGEIINFEAIQDLINIESLDMRGNLLARWVKHYDANTTFDENGTVDENATYFLVKTSSTIPSWIGDLTSLKNLRLSGNDLSGAIPTEIGNLANLEILDFSANRLTKLPSSIGNLSSLIEMHLSSNRIVQHLPVELGSLSNLEKLYLQDNRFFGEIPQELGDMLFLKKLRLNQNNLQGLIPDSLADLDLTQPNGLGLHENCNLRLSLDTNESNDTRDWIDNKSSLYRGYNGVVNTGGHCWTPAMVPILWYLLSDTNTTDVNATE